MDTDTAGFSLRYKARWPVLSRETIARVLDLTQSLIGVVGGSGNFIAAVLKARIFLTGRKRVPKSSLKIIVYVEGQKYLEYGAQENAGLF